VDKTPLAVDLCKVALWIEGHEPGLPLSFLDHHVKLGDSLIGVFDLDVLRAGVPDDAYKPVTGDDKAVANEIRKRNRADAKALFRYIIQDSNRRFGRSAGPVLPQRKRSGSAKGTPQQRIFALQGARHGNVAFLSNRRQPDRSYRRYICPKPSSGALITVGESRPNKLDSSLTARPVVGGREKMSMTRTMAIAVAEP